MIEVDAPYWCEACGVLLYITRDDMYADIEDNGEAHATFSWDIACPRCGGPIVPYEEGGLEAPSPPA